MPALVDAADRLTQTVDPVPVLKRHGKDDRVSAACDFQDVRVSLFGGKITDDGTGTKRITIDIALNHKIPPEYKFAVSNKKRSCALQTNCCVIHFPCAQEGAETRNCHA